MDSLSAFERETIHCYMDPLVRRATRNRSIQTNGTLTLALFIVGLKLLAFINVRKPAKVEKDPYRSRQYPHWRFGHEQPWGTFPQHYKAVLYPCKVVHTGWVGGLPIMTI